MKKILTITLSVLFVFGIFLGIYVYQSITSMSEVVLEEEIIEIDFSEVDDGIYIGEYYYGDLVGVKLEVIIEYGEIIDITYYDYVSGMGEKAKDIEIDIVENQSILVDDVTGATTSSRCIKLAIMEAINNE